MQSKCKAMQSNFIRLVFVLILSNYLIINKAVVSFRYAVFTFCNKLFLENSNRCAAYRERFPSCTPVVVYIGIAKIIQKSTNGIRYFGRWCCSPPHRGY